MPKPPSLNEIRQRAARFAVTWRGAEGYERGEAQSFVRDLLAVYGITESRAGLYEVRAQRSSSGARGYIDALVPGLAVIEMKSAGKDLEVAEKQAMDYLGSLGEAEMPRYVVTSDFRRIRVLDLQMPTGNQDDVLEFAVADLPDNADRLAFFAGYGVRRFGDASREQASIQAAQRMAKLWEVLEGTGYGDHEASVFLVRTLFALYADDAAIWERDLFYEFIATRTNEDGSDLGAQLSFLFQVMATEPERRQSNLDEITARFPYVNGGIFAERLPIPSFDAVMRERLLEACALNWSEISPAIFGSLFQAVKSKTARRELGEHYTTETNILKLIGPMFLDDLQRRLAEHQHDVAGLRRLLRDLGQMRFLDPACGCGNFLVVAYRELRALELAILLRLQELNAGRHAATLMFDRTDLAVQLSHFHGIEIDDWPARIAATAMHLAEHQANQAMELVLGQGPETLPLDKVDTIASGVSALTLDWSSEVAPTANLYVLGNPPFLGHASRKTEQAEELRQLWQGVSIGRLDYVTGWYVKALELFAKPGYDGEFAFVSTNSITQGEPVATLFTRIFADGWRIKFAHRTFAWTSEAPGAAAVHCVIVGFDRHPRRPAWLYHYDQPRGDAIRRAVSDGINAYLVDGPNVLVEQRSRPLAPDLPVMVFGNMPRDDGNLLVEAEDYEEVMADSVAAKYVRPFVGARQLLHSEPRWCLWLTDLDPADVRRSPVLQERLGRIRAFRGTSRAESTRQMAVTPHLFGQRSQPETAYVCVPRHVSEARMFFPTARLGPEVICGDSNFKADDPDGLAFAVISSSMFLAWQKAIGGRIKSDLRFSSYLTWNTFPMARLDDSARITIRAAGKGVLDARSLHPQRSLAEHYDPLAMTPELLRAHRVLDVAIDRAFGLAGKVVEADRLTALFAAYNRLSSSDLLPLPRSRQRKAKT